MLNYQLGIKPGGIFEIIIIMIIIMTNLLTDSNSNMAGYSIISHDNKCPTPS